MTQNSMLLFIEQRNIFVKRLQELTKISKKKAIIIWCSLPMYYIAMPKIAAEHYYKEHQLSKKPIL